MGQRSDSEKLGRRSRTHRTDIQKGNIFPGGEEPPSQPCSEQPDTRVHISGTQRRATRLCYLLEILKKLVTGHKSRSFFRREWAAAAGPPCCYLPDRMRYWIKKCSQKQGNGSELHCQITRKREVCDPEWGAGARPSAANTPASNNNSIVYPVCEVLSKLSPHSDSSGSSSVSEVLWRGTPLPPPSTSWEQTQTAINLCCVRCYWRAWVFSPVRKFHWNQPFAESWLDLIRGSICPIH